MKAKNITERILIFCLTAALGMGMLEGAAAETPVQVEASTKTVKMKGKYYQSSARKMLKKINKFRRGKEAWYYNEDNKKVKLKKLKKLKYDYDLEKTAMLRAAEIAYSFSHERPNGEMCFTAIKGSYMTCGENIAFGYDTYKEVLEAWKETDYDYSGQGHRRNMLSKGFTCVAIACFKYQGQKYWVQEFGSPCSKAKKTKAVNKKKTVKIKVAK